MEVFIKILYENANILYWLFTLFILSYIVGWKFLFSIIRDPKSFKPRLANLYALFLISVLNHGQVPKRFIQFTFTLGLFLSKRLISYFHSSYLISFFVIVASPFVSFILCFLILYGYFYLSFVYPRLLGKALIDFLEINADERILKVLKLKKRK